MTNTLTSAAEVTVEALVLSLRERGAAALSDPINRERLSDLSSAQLRDVIRRLIARRSQFPKVDDDLLSKLEEQL